MYLKIIKREEYEAKIGRTNWLMSDILYTTNAMQWYKFYRRKYMLTKKKCSSDQSDDKILYQVTDKVLEKLIEDEDFVAGDISLQINQYIYISGLNITLNVSIYFFLVHSFLWKYLPSGRLPFLCSQCSSAASAVRVTSASRCLSRWRTSTQNSEITVTRKSYNDFKDCQRWP